MGLIFGSCCRIAPVTSGASQAQSIFTVIKFVERGCRTKPVHGFNLVMTLEASFEWRSRLRGGCLYSTSAKNKIHYKDTKAQKDYR